MEFRDLKQQYQMLKAEIDAAMIAVAGLGTYILGQPVSQLEQALAAYAGTRSCITCANGTDALSMVLMHWHIGPQDAVFVPDFTFFATAEVVCREGATPVLIDVDPDTYNMDPVRLEEAILRVQDEGRLQPKAIIPVDLFGLPANYDRIHPIARQYGLKILEDGAQGFGGTLHGQKACSFGDAATTSFFPAKPLGCYGDGGAVFTDDAETDQVLRSLRAHGKGSAKYDNVRIGLNSRLDTLQAAILLVKLKAFRENELQLVNAAASEYHRNLTDLVHIPVPPAGFSSSWAQYTIQLANRQQRDGLMTYLKQHQIPSMIYYPKPLHLQTALQQLADYRPEDLHQATRLADVSLSLPMHPYISMNDIEQVCEAIRQFMRGQS